MDGRSDYDFAIEEDYEGDHRMEERGRSTSVFQLYRANTARNANSYHAQSNTPYQSPVISRNLPMVILPLKPKYQLVGIPEDMKKLIQRFVVWLYNQRKSEYLTLEEKQLNERQLYLV